MKKYSLILALLLSTVIAFDLGCGLTKNACTEIADVVHDGAIYACSHLSDMSTFGLNDRVMLQYLNGLKACPQTAERDSLILRFEVAIRQMKESYQGTYQRSWRRIDDSTAIEIAYRINDSDSIRNYAILGLKHIGKKGYK